MSRKTFVSKLEINGENVYMKLDWIQNEQDLFKLQVLNPGRDWSGTGSYTMHLVKQYCDKLYQSDREYCENAKKCLSGESSQDEYKFELSVNDITETALFLWKKRFEDIYQLQGSLKLHKDEKSDCKTAFIDFLIDQNNNLETKVTEMKHKAEIINSDLEKYKTELEKLVNEKKSMEQSLYGKFVQLLNTKKQRINLLKNQLYIKS